MKRRQLLIVVLAFATVSCASAVSRQSSPNDRPSPSTPQVPNQSPSISRDPALYKNARAKLEAERVALSSSYQRARTDAEKAEVINRAREWMTKSVNSEIFPFWYGTPWDFNGTTETPGQGKIACGYFVTTVLQDLGLKVQRARLAQQASENIILSLTSNTHIKRFRQKPIGDFVQAVENWGPGLYIVGLDIHVGFILNIDGQVHFVHSSYIDPYSVVNERAIESKILAGSRYRVLGKISADDQFIQRWLLGENITTRIG